MATPAQASAITVDMDTLGSLIACCDPDDPSYHPGIAGAVAQAHHFAARGHTAAMRRWGVEALNMFLLIDSGLHETGLLEDFDTVRSLAEDTLGLHPYGRIPDIDALFDLGETIVDLRLLGTLSGDDQVGLTTFFARHQRGDWGDWGDDQHQAARDNAGAWISGRPIASLYRLPDGRQVLVLTEADRSATTALRPEDY